MSLKRAEWAEMKARAKARAEVGREPLYRGMAQAEVAAEQLTAHPAWNYFVQTLSALRENAEAALAALDASARKSADFSPGGLARAQADRRAWDVRISTLGEIMAIPAQIVDDAGKAKEHLEALNHAETNDKSA